MSIAQDIVDAGLRKLGNHQPQPVDRNNALKALNALIASLSARKLLIPALTRENFTLTINIGSYTIGSAAAFNTVRPTKIENAWLRDGTFDFPPLNVNSNLIEYDRIPDKTLKTLPCTLFYLQEYPLGKILFDYLPDKAYTLFIDSWKPLASLAALNTTVTLPAEYERMLTFNLPVEMASEYDQDLPKEVIAIANESMAIIEAVNHQPIPEMTFDPALLGRKHRGSLTNILTGG